MPFDKQFAGLTELISLKNRRALVTGGASGIGLAGARRLAEAGAVVTLVDINPEKGATALSQLQANGYPAAFLSCDVSREEEVVQAFQTASRQMGGLDILVNNAGIFPAAPLAAVTAAGLAEILAVNLHGVLFFSREAARQMGAQKSGGNIINIASVGAMHPIRNHMAAYDASKGAVIALTRSLARELAPANIRVNAIAPGAIFTEGSLAGPGSDNSRAALRETLSRIPLGRMGAADDVARAILFLASEMAAYITGSVLTVDGGYMVS
jgi:2-dehydro-3-deoxy-D-gluconate 5-dehydrogenase